MHKNIVMVIQFTSSIQYVLEIRALTVLAHMHLGHNKNNTAHVYTSDN